ncbi:hypothetical protein SCA6_007169 [Theobroma cacao]
MKAVLARHRCQDDPFFIQSPLPYAVIYSMFSQRVFSPPPPFLNSSSLSHLFHHALSLVRFGKNTDAHTHRDKKSVVLFTALPSNLLKVSPSISSSRLCFLGGKYFA